jgi:ankyrin repeat protein
MADIITQLYDIIRGPAPNMPHNPNQPDITNYDHFCTLIEQNPGIDLNTPHDQYECLLIMAVNNGRYEYIKQLVNHGANMDYVGARQNNALLNASLMLELQIDPKRSNQCYQTIKCLLECGADCNKRGEQGRTALMNICDCPCNRFVNLANIETDMHNIIDLLIDHGADRDLVDDNGHTAEQMARFRRIYDPEFANHVRDYQPVITKGCYGDDI